MFFDNRQQSVYFSFPALSSMFEKTFFSLGGEFIELRLFFFPEKLLGGNPISLCVEGVLFEEKGIFLVSGKDRFENICSTELSFNADENGAVKPSRCVWVPPQ